MKFTKNKRPREMASRRRGKVLLGLVLLLSFCAPPRAAAAEENATSTPTAPKLRPRLVAPAAPPAKPHPPKTSKPISIARSKHQPDRSESDGTYYGHQLMLTDGLADSLFVTGGVLFGLCTFRGMAITGEGGSSGEYESLCAPAIGFLVAGGGTFLVGAPIQHALHHNVKGAIGSLALRSSVIGLSALLKAADVDSGFLVFNHLVGVRLLDWILLAYEKPQTTKLAGLETTLRPTFLLGSNSTEVSLSGTF